MPSERQDALSSNPYSHAAPLRSHSKKHHSLPASAPKQAAAIAPTQQQPSLSPRKDTKDLNKKYQMANQSAKVPASQAPQRASYPPAAREAPSHSHSTSRAAAAPAPAPAPATAKQHSAAKRTVQSVMAGKEAPPAPPPAPAVEAERQPPNQVPSAAGGGGGGGDVDDDRRVSASYLMKLGILLNVEALFKISPDEVADLMADLGRTYPDLLEGAGLQRAEGRR